MKRLVALVLALVLMLSLAGCDPFRSQRSVPEDFSFAITWNVYGTSSYDSRTGKLIRTDDTDDIDKYTAYYIPTAEELEWFYRTIVSLDISSYPEEYDPQNGSSKPSSAATLTVRANGAEKTITVRDALLYDEAIEEYSKDEQAKEYLLACQAIVEKLVETEVWKNLPEPEKIYI